MKERLGGLQADVGFLRLGTGGGWNGTSCIIAGVGIGSFQGEHRRSTGEVVFLLRTRIIEDPSIFGVGVCRLVSGVGKWNKIRLHSSNIDSPAGKHYLIITGSHPLGGLADFNARFSWKLHLRPFRVCMQCCTNKFWCLQMPQKS